MYFRCRMTDAATTIPTAIAHHHTGPTLSTTASPTAIPSDSGTSSFTAGYINRSIFRFIASCFHVPAAKVIKRNERTRITLLILQEQQIISIFAA